MGYLNLEDVANENTPKTVLFYCAPGVGKSTMLGLLAEKAEGKTLVLDVDRTIANTLAKREVVKDLSKIKLRQIDISQSMLDKKTKEVIKTGTWHDWELTMKELESMKSTGKLAGITAICVDNISELERCLLSDLGALGKNDGVPSQGDYQKVQFKIVNSLRNLKNLGLDVYVTAWEITEQFTNPDGTQYSRNYPKMSAKIVDNVCGICDVVTKIVVGESGDRHLILDATKNTYAKNQIDSRKSCKVEEF